MPVKSEPKRGGAAAAEMSQHPRKRSSVAGTKKEACTKMTEASEISPQQDQKKKKDLSRELIPRISYPL